MDKQQTTTTLEGIDVTRRGNRNWNFAFFFSTASYRHYGCRSIFIFRFSFSLLPLVRSLQLTLYKLSIQVIELVYGLVKIRYIKFLSISLIQLTQSASSFLFQHWIFSLFYFPSPKFWRKAQSSEFFLRFFPFFLTKEIYLVE